MNGTEYDFWEEQEREEQEYEAHQYELAEEYKRGVEETIDKICRYVQTEEFKAEWVNARAVPFGEFLAGKLKETFLKQKGNPYQE